MTLVEYYVVYAILLAGGLALIFYVFIHLPARRIAEREGRPPAE